MPEPAFALPPTMTPDAVPKAPRKVSRRARRVALGLGFGQDVFLVVGLGFLGIGSILATVFCWGLPIDLALDVAGRAAPAQVVSMELDSNVTVNDLHPMAVRFRYAANGAEYVGQSYTTSQELQAVAQRGEALPLEYLPVYPPWARLRGETRALFGREGTFTLLFPGIGLALLATVLLSHLRRRAIYRRGRPILAKVIGVNAGFDPNDQMFLRWQYTVDGKAHSTSLWSKHLDELGVDVSQGAPLTVLYLPRRPGDSVPYLPD